MINRQSGLTLVGQTDEAASKLEASLLHCTATLRCMGEGVTLIKKHAHPEAQRHKPLSLWNPCSKLNVRRVMKIVPGLLDFDGDGRPSPIIGAWLWARDSGQRPK